MPLKSFLGFLLLVAAALLPGPLSAQELNISFQTDPSSDLIRPHAGPVGLSVLVTDATGKPVVSGWADIRLDAPQPGGIISTDIPLVEGTRLFAMRLPLRHGTAEWRYDWPIRGEYRLAVEASAVDGIKASKTFAITVRESATKWLTLGGFTLGLFLFGFMAGRIFTATTGTAASFILALLLSVTALSSAAAQISQTAERSAVATVTIEPAIVGKPSRITWRLDGSGSVSRDVATLTLTITQLEENQPVFVIEKLRVTGEFAMDFQFVDGSEHRVTAIAEVSGRAPVRTEQRIAVTAVEPPVTAALPAIACFLLVIAIGLGVGRWSKLRVAAR